METLNGGNLNVEKHFIESFKYVKSFNRILDGAGCICPPEGRGSAVRHVRQEQRGGDRAGDAQLSGDGRLLYPRGDGAQSGHPGGEVRHRLHLVRGRDPQSDPHRRRLRFRRGLVPRHPDRHQPGRRSRLRRQDCL